MRFTSILISGLFAASCFAGATTQPSTPPQVAVFSFENAGPTNQGWVSHAIEENLIAELSRGQGVWPVRAVANSSNLQDELTTARNCGATYLVTGSYQMIDDQLRATGQVIAASDGHVIGGLKATGTMRDLFTIEDTLATQAKRVLEPQSESLASAEPIQATGPVTQSVPVVTNQFSAAVYAPPANQFVPQYDQYYYYSMPYVYPSYGYAPFYGYGGGIYYGGRGGFYRHGYHGYHGAWGGRSHISWGGAGVVGRSGW